LYRHTKSIHIEPSILNRFKIDSTAGAHHSGNAPQHRAAANTAKGWKNANLLTELRIEN
jgi:hypothetical protein